MENGIWACPRKPARMRMDLMSFSDSRQVASILLAHFYWGQAHGVNPLHDLWENETEVWENGRYMTELITERSVDFIQRSREQEAPFFLFASYNAPHYPMHAPQEYMDRFAHLPWDRHVMAAMIAAVDDGVGEIVKALKETGCYEDTVISSPAITDRPPRAGTGWMERRTCITGKRGDIPGHKASLFERRNPRACHIELAERMGRRASAG